jgi:protein-L-isoaspartate O-methyltransferase
VDSEFYQQHAPALIAQYQGMDAEQVHNGWLKHLPAQPGYALDIGAGSGRDAMWLANLGWHVTAVEPCLAFREAIPAHPHIQLLNDQLPDLAKTPEQSYSLILISAVWMHLTPQEQAKALFRLQALLAEGGVLVITWRNQADETERQFHAVDEKLFEQQTGLACIEVSQSADKGNRAGVVWQCVVMTSVTP